MLELKDDVACCCFDLRLCEFGYRVEIVGLIAVVACDPDRDEWRVGRRVVGNILVVRVIGEKLQCCLVCAWEHSALAVESREAVGIGVEVIGGVVVEAELARSLPCDGLNLVRFRLDSLQGIEADDVCFYLEIVLA